MYALKKWIADRKSKIQSKKPSATATRCNFSVEFISRWVELVGEKHGTDKWKVYPLWLDKGHIATEDWTAHVFHLMGEMSGQLLHARSNLEKALSVEGWMVSTLTRVTKHDGWEAGRSAAVYKMGVNKAFALISKRTDNLTFDRPSLEELYAKEMENYMAVYKDNRELISYPSDRLLYLIIIDDAMDLQEKIDDLMTFGDQASLTDLDIDDMVGPYFKDWKKRFAINADWMEQSNISMILGEKWLDEELDTVRKYKKYIWNWAGHEPTPWLHAWLCNRLGEARQWFVSMDKLFPAAQADRGSTDTVPLFRTMLSECWFLQDSVDLDDCDTKGALPDEYKRPRDSLPVSFRPLHVSENHTQPGGHLHPLLPVYY